MYPESDKDKMNGSLVVIEAENAAAVRAVLEKDIFWANNVVSPSMIPPSHHPSFLWSCSCSLTLLFLTLFRFVILLMGLSSCRCYAQWDKEKLEVRSITVVVNEH